jgi:hypothetical protein
VTTLPSSPYTAGPATIASSPVPTVADWNSHTDWIKVAIDPPRCAVYQTAGTSLTTATQTLVAWDAETYDSDALHSVVSNTSRLSAVGTGLYDFRCSLSFTSNATGLRQLMVRKNAAGATGGGTQVWIGTFSALAINSNAVTVALDVQLTSGDYLEVFAYQSSGGSLSLQSGASVTFASMRWVAKS